MHERTVTIITTLLNANGSNMVTLKEAKSCGLSKYKFYKFVKDNELEQLSGGIYASKDSWVDELLLIHKRSPSAVFSHDEAFFYHGLVDMEPITHTITVYSGFNAHRLKASCNVKVYSVKKELLEVGKILVTDNLGNKVPMYNLERTVCDAFRSRNLIEIQEFNTILKFYIARPDKDLNLLMEYAKLFRVNNVVRKYFEVLL